MTPPEELQRIITKQQLVLGEVATFLSSLGTSRSSYAEEAWALFSRVVSASADAKSALPPSQEIEE